MAPVVLTADAESEVSAVLLECAMCLCAACVCARCHGFGSPPAADVAITCSEAATVLGLRMQGALNFDLSRFGFQALSIDDEGALETNNVEVVTEVHFSLAMVVS